MIKLKHIKMKMSMNRDEYVQYFNARQPPDSRKISEKILASYEQKTNFAGSYNQHIATLEAIRCFLKTIPSNQYLKLVGEKQKRRREPSLFKNTTLEIKAFAIEEKVDHHWSFLAHDLENKQKYCWNHFKASVDKDKNRNQIYFNTPDIIEDFLALNLSGLPFTNNEKQLIMKFLEKYGPYFIGYASFESNTPTDQEWYFRHFWNDFDSFKKSYEIIKKNKKPLTFPHAKTPARILEQLYNRTNSEAYTKWEEDISRVQLWFNIRRTETPLPARGTSPLDFTIHGNRGIGVICSYLYENCNKLIRCPYSLCGKEFFKSRKNQITCCPNHSLLLRVKKYKKKIQG